MSPTATHRDPEAVGPYRLVQRIGEGGMGVVHLGLDPGGRAVAVKVLRAHVAADPDARLRLRREVETLRRVQHPGVAEVIDADVDGELPYLVTRFVPGKPLDAYVRERGPLVRGHLARVGAKLAEALRAIHAVGVVHRDVKPANVMMLDHEPVIIDFGIAHVADESRITHTGLVMGTPGYLSPEVVAGQPVTEATDWWGWGATLAHAATGRPPFGSGPLEVVLDRVRRGDCDLGGIDEGLRAVLAGALTVDPAHRPPPEDLVRGLATPAGRVERNEREGPAAPVDRAAAAEQDAPTGADAVTIVVPPPGEAPTKRVPPPGEAPTTRVPPPERQHGLRKALWGRRGAGAAAGAAGAGAAAGSAAAAGAAAPGAVAAGAAAAPDVAMTEVVGLPPTRRFGPPAGSAPQAAPSPAWWAGQAAPSQPDAPAPYQVNPPNPYAPGPYPPNPYAQSPQAPNPYAPTSHAPSPYAQPQAPGPYAPNPHPQNSQPQNAQPQNPYAPKPSAPHAPAPGAGAAPGAGPDYARGILAGVLVALCAAAVVAPYGMLWVAAIGMTAMRVTDRSATALLVRRNTHGPRGSDGVVTALATPWRVITAGAATLLALILPVMVGISAAFIIGTAEAGTGGRPTPITPTALSLGFAALLLTAWWGPGGGSVRRGARVTARALSRGPRSRAVTWAVLALLTVSALIVASNGTSPDFGPLEGSSLLQQLSARRIVPPL